MTVGAGIFVLPATVAGRLGPSAVLAYFVCALAIGLVLLCFAEAGSRVHSSGGACAYVEAAFGKFAGFVVSVLLWFGFGVASIAAVSNALVDTLATAWPVMKETAPRAGFLLALFAGLAVINIRGVRHAARFVELSTIAKLLPLLLLVAVGAFWIRSDNLAIESLPPGGEFGAATLMLFFAFSGSESAVTPSGEIENSARTVPIGLFLGIVGVVALYVALQIIAQGVLGSELPTHAGAPLAAVADRIIGPAGSTVLLAGAAISMFGTIGGDLLNNPRALFASARDGIMPSWLARVHDRFHTPWIAISVYATLAFSLAVSGAFAPLAVLSSVSVLLVYLATIVATVRLRQLDVRHSERVFRVPGGWLVPALAAVVVAALLAQASSSEWLAVAILTASACAIYALRRLVGTVAD